MDCKKPRRLWIKPPAPLRADLLKTLQTAQELPHNIRILLAAIVLWQMGHPYAAAMKCEDALRIFHGNAFIAYLHASIMKTQGQRQGALKILQSLTTEALDSPYISTEIANLYIAMGEFSAAVERFSKLYEQEPKRVSILMLLGDCYLAQQKSEKARECYQKFLDSAQAQKSLTN